VPLKKPKGIEFVPINQMLINHEDKYKDKHLKTIQLNYGKLPYYTEVFDLLTQFYNYESDLIAEKNLFFITKVCEMLGIKRHFVKSSDLNCHSVSTELLAEICKKVNADVYIYGRGSGGYQDNEILENHNIQPVPQGFIHPKYTQLNTKNFVPGLSIIDALMNVGTEGTKKLFNSGS
jgi:hypothetical protein